MSDVSSTWAPFDHALFEDSAHPFLKKVGVIDVGSNSVRMVVFDGAARSPAYYYNEKIMCALVQASLKLVFLIPLVANAPWQPLNGSSTWHAAWGAKINRSGHSSGAMHPMVKIFVVKFCKKTGQKIWIIDGREEARLSAQGVLLGLPGSYGLVFDSV